MSKTKKKSPPKNGKVLKFKPKAKPVVSETIDNDAMNRAVKSLAGMFSPSEIDALKRSLQNDD